MSIIEGLVVVQRVLPVPQAHIHRLLNQESIGATSIAMTRIIAKEVLAVDQIYPCLGTKLQSLNDLQLSIDVANGAE